MIIKNTPLVSYDAVATACEALTLEGLRPSVRAVMARLGGGSPNVVLDFQRQWKSGRPMVKAVDILIDPRVNQIIAEQISKSIAEASAAAEADRAEAEETLDTMSKTCKESEAKIATLENSLEAAVTQVQSLLGQIEQLNTNVEQVRSAAAEAVNKAEAALVIERQSAESARVELAKAELRLEAVPRIEAEIEKVREELATVRQNAATELGEARTLSAELHEQAAVATAKLQAEQSLRQDIAAQLAEANKTAADAAKRAITNAEALSNEKIIVQTQQSRLDNLVRELAAANESVNLARSEAKKAGEEAAELRGQLSVVNKPAQNKQVNNDDKKKEPK